MSLYPGDCREVLPALTGAVDAVVTDPPYELGFMGRRWDASGVAYDVGVWRECLRLLRPGGYLLAFGGTRTYHRLTCAIEDAGFEIRDSLHWLYGSGFPKGKACLKPGHEPIVLARKPGRRMEPLNIDACRVVTGDSTSRPRGTFPHSDDAWGNGRPSEVSVSHPAGRWPPNVLLTHSAACEPVGTRQVRTGTTVLGNQRLEKFPGAYGSCPDTRTGTRGHGGPDGTETVEAWDCAPDCPVAELDQQSGISRTAPPGQHIGKGSWFGNPGRMNHDEIPYYTDVGGASRFFPVFRYQAKAPSSERPRLPDGTAWPTVKPLGLMRWLVRLVTPPGGTVLDPFAGTGTTGEACALEGFQAILIERDPTALALARQRLNKPAQGVLEAV